MDKKIIGLLFISLLWVPVSFAHGQIIQPPNALNMDITTLALTLVSITMEILWAVAVAFVIVMFVLAGFKFLRAQGDPTEVAEARQAVIWGSVGTAVIILAWSIAAAVRLQLGV